MSLRLVGEAIELEGQVVAKLVSNLRLSLRDRLVELFDAVDEDENYIVELEDRIARLEAKLKEGKPA